MPAPACVGAFTPGGTDTVACTTTPTIPPGGALWSADRWDEATLGWIQVAQRAFGVTAGQADWAVHHNSVGTLTITTSAAMAAVTHRVRFWGANSPGDIYNDAEGGAANLYEAIICYCFVPDTPTGLVAVFDAPDGAQIAWNASAGADGYRLYRDGVEIYDGPLLAFEDTGLTPGETYAYTVEAYECGVSELSDEVEVYVEEPESEWDRECAPAASGVTRECPPAASGFTRDCAPVASGWTRTC